MGDSGESYTNSYIKQIIGKALKGPKQDFSDSYQGNNVVSKMEMAKILSDLKAVGASKNNAQEKSQKYAEVYKEDTENKEGNGTFQEYSMTNEASDYNVKCGDSEGMKEQQLVFELTNEQLTQAIIYSEILGKPKCKTRRRG